MTGRPVDVWANLNKAGNVTAERQFLGRGEMAVTRGKEVRLGEKGHHPYPRPRDSPGSNNGS